MKEMSEQHDQAMALAGDADLAIARGDVSVADSLYHAAFDLEKRAADSTAATLDLEPTRSILHRSAASLALQIKEYRECERLVCRALVGNPPIEIADELRQLWEQASFAMHMKIRDFELADNELLVSMWGAAVGHGFAPCDEVVERLSGMQKLLFRTVERLTKQPYREHGGVSRIVKENFDVWASVAKAASYAFVLRVGTRDAQGSLFDVHGASRVVDEVMSCMEFVSRQDADAIEKRIADRAYFRNFMGLARQIAPRGKGISHVGFAASSKSKIQEVIVVAPRARRVHSMPLFGGVKGRDTETISVEGELLFADARMGRKSRIVVNDTAGISHEFVVPRGLMSDVVRPYFEKRVVVHGMRRFGANVFESIADPSLT